MGIFCQSVSNRQRVSQRFRHIVEKMGQKDCLGSTKDLFSELGSFQIKYQAEFSKIIDSHNSILTKSINDLMVEISDLRSLLSISKSECDNSNEKVKNLRDEIRQVKSGLAKSLTKHEENDLKKKDEGHMDNKVAKDQGEDNIDKRNETAEVLTLNHDNQMGGATAHEISDDVLYESLILEVEEESNDQDEFQDKAKTVSEDVTSSGFTVDLSAREKKEKFHSYLIPTEKATDKVMNKMYRCEVCPFKTKSRQNLNQHRRLMHNKWKKYQCRQCNHVSTSYGNLMDHIDLEHDVCHVKVGVKRQLIADCLKEKKSIPQICKELRCSDYLVYKVKKLIENNESLSPKKAPGRRRKLVMNR